VHRLFFAKTKIMAKALGQTSESEHLPGLASLSKHLHSDVGLLCSPRPPTDVLSYFSTYTPTDFARAGTKATYTFSLPAGVLHSQGGQISADEDQPIQHSTEPMLRKWGLATRLEKGKVVLEDEHVVCEEGTTLDSHQTAILKFFGVAMAEFRVKVVAYWQAEGGEVTVVEEEGAMEE
jgi:mRNA turnover protein 4